jgi:hypothetical protein
MYVLVDIRYVIDNYEKTGCNRLQPVFYGFLKFFKLRQPATEPTAKRGNRNRWSGCFRLRSVRFWCFFRFRELDLQTLKSDAEVNRLVQDVLLDPKFKAEDLRGFSAAKENRQSDAAEKKTPFADSFQTADINIEVPSGDKSVPPATFSVPGLLYRKLTTVIQATFSSPLGSHFHFSPFMLFHRSPSGEEQRVFSEVYNLDVCIDEHDNIQRAPLPPDEPFCKLEKVLDYDEMDEGLGGDEDKDEEGGSDDDEDYGYASA